MDLTLALMRVEEIETQIARYPQAVADTRLAALLRSLRDELTDQQIIASASEEV